MQQNIAAYSINLQKENKKRRKKIIIEKLIEGLKKNARTTNTKNITFHQLLFY